MKKEEKHKLPLHHLLHQRDHLNSLQHPHLSEGSHAVMKLEFSLVEEEILLILPNQLATHHQFLWRDLLDFQQVKHQRPFSVKYTTVSVEKFKWTKNVHCSFPFSIFDLPLFLQRHFPGDCPCRYQRQRLLLRN